MNRLARTCLSTAVALAAAVGLAGCEERLTMPEDPAAAASPGRWRTVYPDRPVPELECIFALDADDVWVGGSAGRLVRILDGVVTHHALPGNGGRLDEIHGCAWDEIWARDGDRLYRWDGRSWREGPSADPEGRLDTICIWNDAPGVVYAGGLDWLTGRGYVQCWRAGVGWKRWLLPEGSTKARRIWRPEPDGPLLVLVEVDHDRALFTHTAAGWEQVALAGRLRQARGSFVVVTVEADRRRDAAYRIGRGGELVLLCTDFDWDFDRLLDCRYPLFEAAGQVDALVGCRRETAGELPDGFGFWERDSAVPRRPGSSGSYFFLLGDRDEVRRFRWRSDGSLDQTTVYEPPAIVPDDNLAVIGDDLLVVGSDGGLGVRTAGVWHAEDIGAREAYAIDVLGDGSALVGCVGDGSRRSWGRRHPDGRWHWYPDLTDVRAEGAWCDATTGDLHVMTDEAEFLVCRDGVWTARDDLGGDCHFYGAVSADRQYARIRTDDGANRIAFFDGARWRDITPAGDGWLHPIMVTPYGGELLVMRAPPAGDAGHWTPLRHDGEAWRRGDATVPPLWFTSRWQESAPGEIYFRNGTREIWRLHADGVKPVVDADSPDYPGRGIRSFWIDPDRGLHVIDDLHQIHHLPSLPR